MFALVFSVFVLYSDFMIAGTHAGMFIIIFHVHLLVFYMSDHSPFEMLRVNSQFLSIRFFMCFFI